MLKNVFFFKPTISFNAKVMSVHEYFQDSAVIKLYEKKEKNKQGSISKSGGKT